MAIPIGAVELIGDLKRVLENIFTSIQKVCLHFASCLWPVDIKLLLSAVLKLSHGLYSVAHTLSILYLDNTSSHIADSFVVR